MNEGGIAGPSPAHPPVEYDPFGADPRWSVATLSAFVGVTLLLAWYLVLSEISGMDRASANWISLLVVGALLIVLERTEFVWIRFGPSGVVTPLAMLSFVMIQIGSSSLTVGIAVVGATLHSIKRRTSPSDTIAHVTRSAISIAGASLVLAAIDSTYAQSSGDISWRWAAAVGAAGALMIGLDAALLAVWQSTRQRSSFWSLLRRAVVGRVNAEGTLMTLAPILALALGHHPALIPLAAVGSCLTYVATRHAVQQAHAARHDPLTGLYNRTAFREHVEEALSSPHDGPTLVALMDLNGFKDVNDRLGHQMGDTLLIAFAERLEAGRPSNGCVARLGGDEFAVVACRTHRDPEELIAGLHHFLTQPLTLEGLPVTVGVSIGLAISGRDGQTPSDLIRAADLAMYKAKRTSSPFARFEAGGRSQHGRLDLLGDLKAAIAGRQLHLNFQPQLRMADGAVDTVEALIRWEHPEHGTIPPADFIGLAEQTDLIRPITEMVIRTATHTLMESESAVRLAINISARSLEDNWFATSVFEILQETGFPPYRLELEVTERALVQNLDPIGYTVSKLRRAGVRIAIDDFGSGYSSYETLRVVDVDRVKIDRDFVQGLLVSDRDRKIVSSVITLAHELGLDVVAEGVESSQVWNALLQMGCDVAQGYGIAVPMDDDATHAWLAMWDAVALGEPPLPRRVRFASLDE